MSTSIPLPGQHRPSSAGDESSADPDTVRSDVAVLLSQLTIDSGDDGPEVVDSDALTRDADLLDRAHEVLVRALTTVDKT
ncbi:hypothetical protein HQO83_17630 [Rhodococcus fascians]|nr:hypothetical protein [Rhodococcus fascians]